MRICLYNIREKDINMERKYELTENTKTVRGHTVYQIKAVKDFRVPLPTKSGKTMIVKKGDLGGFIEREANLSQRGSCWIAYNVVVYEDARICDDAYVTGIGAIVKGNAFICEHAYIHSGIVDDSAIIDGSAILVQSAVHHNAHVGDHAIVASSFIADWVEISDNARVTDGSVIHEYARVTGAGRVINSEVIGDAVIQGYLENEVRGI